MTAAPPPISPRSTERRERPVANWRVKASNTCPSMFHVFLFTMREIDQCTKKEGLSPLCELLSNYLNLL
jgi:hypothetical protein